MESDRMRAHPLPAKTNAVVPWRGRVGPVPTGPGRGSSGSRQFLTGLVYTAHHRIRSRMNHSLSADNQSETWVLD